MQPHHWTVTEMDKLGKNTLPCSSCCIQQEQLHICGVGSIGRAFLHVEFKLSHGLGIVHMAKLDAGSVKPQTLV